MIPRALFQKLARLPEWLSFQADFAAATGLDLELVDERGQGLDGRRRPRHNLCAAVRACPQGERFCESFRQGLLQRSLHGPVNATCDAGLNEAAVPMRMGETTVGFFLFGPFRSGPVSAPALHRARHLLERAGIPIGAEPLRSWLEAARDTEPRAVEAYIHFVKMAAHHLAERLTTHLSPSLEKMPPAVERACTLIRSEGIVRPLTLAEAARRCGISQGHLSRTFHQATGFTFSEYLARTRAEQAHALLRDPRRNITEIAFAAGFQSIAQFHRVFRKVYGMSPGALRRQWAQGAAG